MKKDLLTQIANKIAQGDSPAKEGSFGAPIGQILSHLQHFLSAKYAVEMSYRSFADRVRGPWRDALVDHWHEHAKEERESSYQLAMKVVGMGGDPIQTTISIPACPANISGFCQSLIAQELDAIEAGRKLVLLAGTNTALKVLAENTILLDTHHLDDLRRMNEF